MEETRLSLGEPQSRRHGRLNVADLWDSCYYSSPPPYDEVGDVWQYHRKGSGRRIDNRSVFLHPPFEGSQSTVRQQVGPQGVPRWERRGGSTTR